MTENDNLHRNHRQRVKAHMLSKGFDGFNEHQILEALLFYAVPRTDTNPMAHMLLNRFGSIFGVLNASVEELSDTAGIKENSSLLIKLVAEVTKIYWCEEQDGKEQPILDNVKKIADYMIPRFIGTNNEELFLLCTDNSLRLINAELLMRGSVNRVSLDCRKIIEIVLKYKATNVILSHNHPDSSANPSNEDIVATTYIKKSLGTINIDLVDHVIVSGKNFTSMRQMNYI